MGARAGLLGVSPQARLAPARAELLRGAATRYQGTHRPLSTPSDWIYLLRQYTQAKGVCSNTSEPSLEHLARANNMARYC